MKKILGKKFPRHAELVSASHESEIPNQVRNDVKRIRRAFTLAETLITLMIIGVVAVLVIPAFMSNINENAMARQRDVFSKKFTEGLRQMRVDGKLNQKYASTQAFVNEMKNYFKINGTCESTNLGGCFPAQTISAVYEDKDNPSANSEKTYTISDTNKFKPSEISESYKNYDNFMSLNFADGVNLILAVNKECIGPAEGATQSDVTTCIAYIADVNGAKSPNKTEKDIVTNMELVHAYGLSFSMINNTAYLPGDKAIGTDGEEVEYTAIDGTTYEASPGAYDEDYWAGANEFCKKLGGSLPSKSQLSDIAKAIGYNTTDCTCGDSGDNASYFDCCDTTKIESNSLFKKLAGSNSWFFLWSSVPYDNDYAYYRIFTTYCSSYYDGYRGSYGISAICVR